MAAQLWVIGSGKGGVGKTFIVSSLGITLSKLDKKILLIDLDFGGANLHTSLGCPHSDTNLFHYWSGEKKLRDCVLETQVPRLSYVQGHWDQWTPMSQDLEKGRQLVADARELNYDIVIFDVGPGATEFHLDLFHQADEKFLVVSPEPTSIEKTYRYLESLITWTLKESATPDAYQRLLKALSQYRSKHSVGAFSFHDYLSNAVGFQFDYFAQLDQKPVRMIVNQARSQQDRDLGYSIQSVCRKFYDLPVHYVGWIDYDNAVWQSIRVRRPVLIDKPFTPLAGQFLSMSRELTQTNFVSQFLRAVV
jgi:flagellar biosynthesis protein FlhG